MPRGIFSPLERVLLSGEALLGAFGTGSGRPRPPFMRTAYRARVCEHECARVRDRVRVRARVERLRTLEIGNVYPGHGEPFQMEQFKKDSG